MKGLPAPTAEPEHVEINTTLHVISGTASPETMPLGNKKELIKKKTDFAGPMGVGGWFFNER